MEFWNQVLATLIGVIGGFIFSLVLFYLKESHIKKTEKKELKMNLRNEINYNIKFFDKLLRDIESVKSKITGDSKEIYPIFEFYRLQRYFLVTAFKKGYLYKVLELDQVNEVDTMLSYFPTNQLRDQIAFNTIKQFQKNEITKNEALEHFEFHINEIYKFRDFLNKIKPKLEEI